MKKILIFTSLFIAWIYLSSAISITLNSWKKLESSSWTNLSSVLNKVDVSWNNLSVNWKLSINWKICIETWCLWECSWWQIWDKNTNTCILPATTPETAWKTCKTILDENPWTPSWLKWIDPDGDWWLSPFQAYCDMTTNGWGRTKWYDSNNSVWDIQAAINCRDNWYNFDDGFYCIAPEILPDWEYMLNNSWNIFYPTVKVTPKNSTAVKWWHFRESESPLIIYTCREFNNNWWNYARYWTSWTIGNYQKNINCFVR
jgi:hypothetical protein